MARRAWFPGTRAEQLAMFTNIKGKIDAYKVVLPITGPQADRIKLICDEFIVANDYVDAMRATTARTWSSGVTTYLRAGPRAIRLRLRRRLAP
ncbi:MAG: hypothetical protein IPG22_19985 [Acidobacteria bacterium]|nr:hypothetical protein [Acidobacteriota bacterium]